MNTPGTIAFAAVLAVLPLTGPTDSGTFTIDQRGQQVGTAEFHITPSASGFESSSIVQVHMQGLDYALSNPNSSTRHTTYSTYR